MKFVFASDSLKGTISSRRAAELLTASARKVFGDCETVSLCIADGGEGTAEAVAEACSGRKVFVEVHDPLMNVIRAYYIRLDDNTVLIEMAQASGLMLVPEGKRNPLVTTSYGTGELVKHALKAGCGNIIIAIGGSATNDGGTGFANALGVRFIDAEGNELPGNGSSLEKIADIDISGLPKELEDVTLTVMCDVTNPLCGPFGATMIYGGQKGGTPESLALLEAGMVNYGNVLKRRFGVDPDSIKGAGAAGGLGAALSLIFGAKTASGIDALLDMVHFDELAAKTDIVITGEGRLDSQSLNGKAVSGIAKRAKKLGKPVYVICGCLGSGYEEILGRGVTRIFTTCEEGMSPDEAMAGAEELYTKTADRMFREIKESMDKQQINT